MYCHKCGTKLSKKVRYCPNCGESVVSEEMAESEVITETSESKAPIVNVEKAKTDIPNISENEELGKFWYRFGAYMIDFAIAVLGGAVILGIIVYFFNPESSFFDELDTTTDRLLTLFLLVTYHSLALSWHSTTFGKKLLGLKVIDATTGQAINRNTAIKRSLSYILSSLIFGLGFLRIATDHDKRQGLHDKIAKTLVVREKNKKITAGVLLSIVATILVLYFNFYSYIEETYDNTITQPTQSQPAQNPQDIVSKADYQEGYKAGYVDGRSYKGQVGDSFAPPATEERRTDYLQGYLDGFVKGCREGNFDCTEVENAINELNQESSNGVELIPSGVY